MQYSPFYFYKFRGSVLYVNLTIDLWIHSLFFKDRNIKYKKIKTMQNVFKKLGKIKNECKPHNRLIPIFSYLEVKIKKVRKVKTMKSIFDQK